MGRKTDMRAECKRARRYWRACLRRATPAECAAGAEWYATARATARELATAYGVPLEVAAGVIAATSPRERWARNVFVATEILRGGTPTGLSSNMARARRVVAAGDSWAGDYGPTAPKVSAFYANIMGNEDAVTIDTWMLVAGGLTRQNMTALQYAALADSLRKVAAEFHLSPAVAQAIIWVVVRGSAV